MTEAQKESIRDALERWMGIELTGTLAD